MPYDTLHVHISQPSLKEEIRAAAEAQNMSVSKFMIFCYSQIKPDLAKLAAQAFQRRTKVK